MLGMSCYFTCARVWCVSIILYSKALSCFQLFSLVNCFRNLFILPWVGQLATSSCCVELCILHNHFPRPRHLCCHFHTDTPHYHEHLWTCLCCRPVREFLWNPPPRVWVPRSLLPDCLLKWLFPGCLPTFLPIHVIDYVLFFALPTSIKCFLHAVFICNPVTTRDVPIHRVHVLVFLFHLSDTSRIYICLIFFKKCVSVARVTFVLITSKKI